ncbi:MAG: glycosyltransferase family 4 protein [Methylosarcina sp.]
MVLSPIATGNGAFVVHKTLERAIKNYKVVSFNPYLTLIPPLLYGVGRVYKANLIHTTPDYGIYHVRRKVPLILTFHNYVLDSFMRNFSSPLQNIHYKTDLKWFTKCAVEQAALITAVSQFTGELVRKELNINRELKVIYNGIDHHCFSPGLGLKKNNNKIHVLFSGNLTRRKGAQWLFPILEKLDHRIVIQYTSGLRERRKLPDHPRLKCVGSVSHQDMPNLYRQADILLFPTVREGFGLAVAEAMSCGLPVVATDCSSLPELIDHGKGGFLCPLGDVQVFGNCINRLAEDPYLCKEMGEYNRSKVESSFTLQRMAMAYRCLFEEAMDTRF